MRARGRSGRDAGSGEKRLAVCSGVEWVGIRGVSGQRPAAAGAWCWIDRWGREGVAGAGTGTAQAAACCPCPCSLAFLSPCCCPCVPHTPTIFLCGARVNPPRPLAFALRPRWHHWVSGLDEVRPIESAFFLAADFASAAAAASSSSLLRRRNCALEELWSGDWSAPPLLWLVCRIESAGLRRCGRGGPGCG